MRLSEASAHLASFSARLKDETSHAQLNSSKEESAMAGWVAVTVVKAADAVLSTCPSIYEKRCLLQLLAVVDFSDGGSSAAYFRRGYWKIILAEPSVCKDGDTYKWNDSMDDASLLASLEKDGRWEEARTWARQLESSDVAWESTFDHVTESQVFGLVFGLYLRLLHYQVCPYDFYADMNFFCVCRQKLWLLNGRSSSGISHKNVQLCGATVNRFS